LRNDEQLQIVSCVFFHILDSHIDRSTVHTVQISQSPNWPTLISQVLLRTFVMAYLFRSLVTLQAQASSEVVEDIDVVVDTSESALARSLGKDRNIGKRVHTLIS